MKYKQEIRVTPMTKSNTNNSFWMSPKYWIKVAFNSVFTPLRSFLGLINWQENHADTWKYKKKISNLAVSSIVNRSDYKINGIIRKSYSFENRTISSLRPMMSTAFWLIRYIETADIGPFEIDITLFSLFTFDEFRLHIIETRTICSQPHYLLATNGLVLLDFMVYIHILRKLKHAISSNLGQEMMFLCFEYIKGNPVTH